MKYITDIYKFVKFPGFIPLKANHVKCSKYRILEHSDSIMLLIYKRKFESCQMKISQLISWQLILQKYLHNSFENVFNLQETISRMQFLME